MSVMSSACDHKSVGIIVWQNEKLLLIERKKPPYGYAPPAGHVDSHGGYEQAAREELKEEVGLTSTSLFLKIEGRKENRCRREEGSWHYWKIYEAQTSGNIKPSPEETKKVIWAPRLMIQNLASRTKQYLENRLDEKEWEKNPGIEPVWYEWFKEVKIL